MAVAVAVAFAVRRIVFVPVADQIAQGKAVVCGDEIDARLRQTPIMPENFARPGQPLCQCADTGLSRQPEGAHVIAETIVPLAPAGREVAEPIAIHAQIPGFGNQLDALEHRVLADRGEKGAFARQCRGQIEAEAVDVHFLDPVTQCVHDQLQNARMREIQRIAAATEVFIAHRVVGRQAVVADVVDATKTQRRAGFVTLGRVVENDVENDLDAFPVQCPHHGSEFINDRLFAAGVA